MLSASNVCKLYMRRVRRSVRMSASNGGDKVAERGKVGRCRTSCKIKAEQAVTAAHLLSSWLMIMYISQLVSSVIPP